MRLRVRYSRPRDLVEDHERQFVRGGLLVRVEPPAGLALFAAVELEIRAPAGTVTLPAQVVQLVPGAGVAVAFDAKAPPLVALVEDARRRPDDGSGEPPAHALGADEPETETEVAPRPPPAAPKAAAVNEKIHQALHGNKDERAAILRDVNRTLHPYVLKNPHIQLDEIVAIARMATAAPDLLKAIADKREWSQRPEVALALVRNPKVPVPLALRLLDNVSPADLRQLAKDSRTREAIQRAARKKVIG